MPEGLLRARYKNARNLDRYPLPDTNDETPQARRPLAISIDTKHIEQESREHSATSSKHRTDSHRFLYEETPIALPKFADPTSSPSKRGGLEREPTMLI